LQNFSILRSRAGPTYYKLLRNFVLAQESQSRRELLVEAKEIPLDVIDKTHKSRIRSVAATQTKGPQKVIRKWGNHKRACVGFECVGGCLGAL